MEYVILILVLFIGINTAVKLSFWKLWQVCVASAAMALFVISAYPWAIELSKTELHAMMQTPEIMQNIAVIVTLETVVFFAFSFAELKQTMGKKKVNPYALLALRFYPGLLVYPALFFVLVQLIFSFPGAEFSTLAYVSAATLLVSVPIAVWIFRKLFPENDFRLELLFITNLITCIIGLITTVNGNTVYRPVEQPLNPASLLTALGGFAALFAAGFLFNKFKKRKI